MSLDQESDSLLQKSDVKLGEISDVMTRFMVMSIPFSMINALYTVSYGYVSSVLSLELAGYASGASYLTYMITSLLFAALLVDMFGPRKMMICSQLCFALFSVCLVIVSFVSQYNIQWSFLMIGSILKGFGSPIGWVSQGVYFATYAELYAKQKNMNVLEANALLASYFATSRVGFQGFFYLLSSILLEFSDMDIDYLFLLFGIWSFLCLLFIIIYLDDIPIIKKESDSMFERAIPVLIMASTDFVAICISPLTITFGFVQIFMFVYVNEKIASDHFPDYVVGYLNVIYVVANVLVSIPVALYCTRTTAVSIGASAYMLLAIPFLCVSDNVLGESKYIWMLYVCYGIGRMSWESTSKAIYADLYPEKRSVAFAHLSFLNGVSSGIFSFIVSNVSSADLGIMLLIPAALMVPGYLTALKLRESKNS